MLTHIHIERGVHYKILQPRRCASQVDHLPHIGVPVRRWFFDYHCWRLDVQLYPSRCSIWKVRLSSLNERADRATDLQISIVQSVNYPINPHIYGVNFPPTASYINHLGVTLSRWGGNAVTPYNPFGHFTNAGNDWYFENRASDWGSADEWVGWVSGAGSDTILTVPG